MNDLKFVYFGGEPIGAPVLEELLTCGLKPSLVVCNPDRPAGRGKKLTSPPVKVLAEEHDIPVYQPESIKNPEDIPELSEKDYDLFVVVAYNKIMPEWLIDLPKHKTINLHPSMLPLRRGPNPIRSAIVENDPDSVGASIMLMDKEMDHGPILDQQTMTFDDENWPVYGPTLEEALSYMGGAMLAKVIPQWASGEIEPQEQDHKVATYTSKVSKADGELSIDPHNLPSGSTAKEYLFKIKGYDGFPGTFFFYNEKRIKITEAELTENGELRIITVVPEGKTALPFKQWLQN